MLEQNYPNLNSFLNMIRFFLLIRHKTSFLGYITTTLIIVYVLEIVVCNFWKIIDF